jgi:hypothetical protein
MTLFLKVSNYNIGIIVIIMSYDIPLREFDMSRIKSTNMCVFIGKRNTGKSFLIRDLLYHHKDLPLGTVLSGTEAANGFYKNMVPELFIHHDYSPEVLHNVVRRQAIMKYRLEDKPGSLDPRAFLIMDDLMYDSRKWIKDPNVKMLFFNGRHWDLFFMLSLQSPLAIPPELRANIDFTFILREPNFSNRKRLYEHYAGMFPSFDSFCSAMNSMTDDFGCLVIDNTVKSNRPENQVFWYKAKDHPDFRVGSPQFWDPKRNQELRRQRREAMMAEPTAEDVGRKNGKKFNVRKVVENKG